MNTAQQIEEKKDSDYKLCELEGDEDLDVVTEIVETNETSTTQQPNREAPSPSQTMPPIMTPQSENHTDNSGWAGFFGKHFGSGKGKTLSETETQKKKDWSKEQEALNKFKTSAVTTFSQMSTRVGEGGAYLYEATKRGARATTENLKKIRIFKTPLENMCKIECASRPCPRVLLVCCTAIASSGLSSQDIFKVEAPEELVIAILNHLQNGYGAMLPPIGATPEVLAGVIKKFLSESIEPLLTYKLCEEWITVCGDLESTRTLMQQLPVVNRNALSLLLDCLHRVSANAAENNMDSGTLAESLAPCLLWKPPKTADSGKRIVNAQGTISKMLTRTNSGREVNMKTAAQEAGSAYTNDNQREEEDETIKQTKIDLQGEELQKFTRVVDFMISDYKLS